MIRLSLTQAELKMILDGLLLLEGSPEHSRVYYNLCEAYNKNKGVL